MRKSEGDRVREGEERETGRKRDRRHVKREVKGHGYERGEGRKDKDILKKAVERVRVVGHNVKQT